MRQRHRILRGAWLAGLAWSAGAEADPPAQLVDISNQAQTVRPDPDEPKSGKPQLLVVPIPQSNPALGSGATLAGVLFYNPNKAPQPWISGVGLMRTSNKSKAIGAFHTMSLKDDRFRIAALVGYADLSLKFYGVGPNAGDRDRFVKLEDKGLGILMQAQMRIVKNLYVGARYEYLALDSSVKIPNPIFPDLQPPRIELKSNLSAIGPMMSYDSRDSSTNARKGEYAVVTWLMNSSAIGSDFSHTKLDLQLNAYRPLGASTVIAGRAILCGVSTGGPFYNLCNYGQMGDLRGYEPGRYRDRAMWAAQVELRRHLFWRIGVVAFGGIGGTAPSIRKLDDTKWLPAAGGGLRFLVSRQNNVNLRLDYARGRHSDALYFGIGEVF